MFFVIENPNHARQGGIPGRPCSGDRKSTFSIVGRIVFVKSSANIVKVSNDGYAAHESMLR